MAFSRSASSLSVESPTFLRNDDYSSNGSESGSATISSHGQSSGLTDESPVLSSILCSIHSNESPTHDSVAYAPVDPTIRIAVKNTQYSEVYCQPYEFAGCHPISGLEDCVLFGIAMYNETPDFFLSTIEAIIKTSPRFHLEKKIATVIMLDGIDAVNPTTKAYFQEMGLWLPIAENTDGETEERTVHLFQGTAHCSVAGINANMEVILLLKIKNGGKLSSQD